MAAGGEPISDHDHHPESDLPSYNQLEDKSTLRLCIVNNPKTPEDSTSRRVITANPISATGIFNDLSRTRSYYPKYLGATKFEISCQASGRPSITYIPKSKDTGLVQIAHPQYEEPTVFHLEVRCHRVKVPHVNALLERLPPLPLHLITQNDSRDGTSKQPFSWRAVLPTGKIHKSRSTEPLEGAQNIDLVLLGPEFREYAYFKNQMKPVTEEANNVWGVLEVKLGLEDDMLVDQIILSLLTLIHVYNDKTTYAGRWSDVVVGMLTGSIMCQVM